MLGLQQRQRETVKEKSWEDFQKTGLFWLINSILHVFGWAIVYEWDSKQDGEKIWRVYPARVTHRGFSADVQEAAHGMIAKYMAENSQELKKEAEL